MSTATKAAKRYRYRVSSWKMGVYLAPQTFCNTMAQVKAAVEQHRRELGAGMQTRVEEL